MLDSFGNFAFLSGSIFGIHKFKCQLFLGYQTYISRLSHIEMQTHLDCPCLLSVLLPPLSLLSSCHLALTWVGIPIPNSLAPLITFGLLHHFTCCLGDNCSTMDALTGHQRESYLTAHYLHHNQQGLKYWTLVLTSECIRTNVGFPKSKKTEIDDLEAISLAKCYQSNRMLRTLFSKDMAYLTRMFSLASNNCSK